MRHGEQTTVWTRDEKAFAVSDALGSGAVGNSLVENDFARDWLRPAEPLDRNLHEPAVVNGF